MLLTTDTLYILTTAKKGAILHRPQRVNDYFLTNL